jgi:hypothetical protein
MDLFASAPEGWQVSPTNALGLWSGYVQAFWFVPAEDSSSASRLWLLL